MDSRPATMTRVLYCRASAPLLFRPWWLLTAAIYGWLVLGVLPRYIDAHRVELLASLAAPRSHLAGFNLSALARYMPDAPRHSVYNADGHLCMDQSALGC